MILTDSENCLFIVKLLQINNISNMSKYFFQDADLEEALLKVCILFDNNGRIVTKKDSLF